MSINSRIKLVAIFLGTGFIFCGFSPPVVAEGLVATPIKNHTSRILPQPVRRDKQRQAVDNRSKLVKQLDEELGRLDNNLAVIRTARPKEKKRSIANELSILHFDQVVLKGINTELSNAGCQYQGLRSLRKKRVEELLDLIGDQIGLSEKTNADPAFILYLIRNNPELCSQRTDNRFVQPTLISVPITQNKLTPPNNNEAPSLKKIRIRFNNLNRKKLRIHRGRERTAKRVYRKPVVKLPPLTRRVSNPATSRKIEIRPMIGIDF